MTKNKRQSPPEEENNVWPSWQEHDPPGISFKGSKSSRWLLVPIGIFVVMNLFALIRYGLHIDLTAISHPLTLALVPEYASLLIVIFGVLYSYRLWRKPPTPILADIAVCALLVFFAFFMFIALSVSCDRPVYGMSCTEQSFLWARVILTMGPIIPIMNILLIIGIISLLIRRRDSTSKTRRDKKRERTRRK